MLKRLPQDLNILITIEEIIATIKIKKIKLRFSSLCKLSRLRLSFYELVI